MTCMPLTPTATSVQTTLALLQRATYLMDDGDELASDPLASSRLAHLALAGWMITPEPIAPDLEEAEVADCSTARQCLDRARVHATGWDLGQLTPQATRFVLDLYELTQL